MKVLLDKRDWAYLQNDLFPKGDSPKSAEADLLSVIQAGLSPLHFELNDYVVIDVSNEHFYPAFMQPIKEDMVSAVLMEKSRDCGFTKEDILTILSEMESLGIDTSYEMLPVKVDSDCGGTAFGFILEAAADRLDYIIDQPCEPGSFADCVETIMNDMKLEHDDNLYTFCGIRTKLLR